MLETVLEEDFQVYDGPGHAVVDVCDRICSSEEDVTSSKPAPTPADTVDRPDEQNTSSHTQQGDGDSCLKPARTANLNNTPEDPSSGATSLDSPDCESASRLALSPSATDENRGRRDASQPLSPLRSPCKTSRRLTPEAMLTHLHTIQTEEQKRLSERRESLSLDLTTLLPSTPEEPSSPPRRPADSSPAEEDHDDPHINDDGNHPAAAPYASCTHRQLALASSRLRDTVQQFQDVVCGLQDAISRHPRRAHPELSSLERRLGKVHSLVQAEHEVVAEEIRTRGEAEKDRVPPLQKGPSRGAAAASMRSVGQY